MEPVPLKAPALPDSGNNSTPGPSRQAANQQMVFDFTKRKRWADLLVTELTEAIMLVLSVTGQVWYCGPAIEELLGWRDEEIVDGDFCEIMNSQWNFFFLDNTPGRLTVNVGLKQRTIVQVFNASSLNLYIQGEIFLVMFVSFARRMMISIRQFHCLSLAPTIPSSRSPKDSHPRRFCLRSRDIHIS